MEEEFVLTFLLQNELIRQHLVFMLEGRMPGPHHEANMVAETDIGTTVVVVVTAAHHPLTAAEDDDHHRLAIVVAHHRPTAEEDRLHHMDADDRLHLMEDEDRHPLTVDVAHLPHTEVDIETADHVDYYKSIRFTECLNSSCETGNFPV